MEHGLKHTFLARTKLLSLIAAAWGGSIIRTIGSNFTAVYTHDWFGVLSIEVRLRKNIKSMLCFEPSWGTIAV